MSDLKELVAEWSDLLGFSDVPEQNELEFVREDRVLELTARYVNKLQSIQEDHDSDAAMFAERVRMRAQGSCTNSDLKSLDVMAQRFLAGIGMTFFNEIPKTIPRSKRASVETLEIDWGAKPTTATWKEVDVSFPLRPVLSFCAEHSAGADKDVRNFLVEQLVFDLQNGAATVGMVLQSHNDSKSVLLWKPAVVSLDDATADSAESTAVMPEESAIEVYLSDCARTLVADLDKCDADVGQFTQTAHAETALVFDDLEEPDADDPIRRRINEFVVNASESTERKMQIIGAMTSSAYVGLIAAKAVNDEGLFLKRGRVLKCIKSLISAHSQPTRERELV